jgi:hypothetical protein
LTTPSLRTFALAAIAALALCLPAVAAAGEPGTGGATAPAPSEPAPVPPAPPAGEVSVDGAVAVAARAGTLLGRVARFRGAVRRRDARRPVVVQRFDDEAQRWVRVARTQVAADGTFVARWRTDVSGRLRLRAVLRSRHAGQAARGRSQATVASSELGVTVYRPAFATWYGTGLFGNHTACGQLLTPELQGVAHKRLPCGTRVALLYDGRTLVVPVIDRGPFRDDTEWDLTQATAQSLGMEASDTVGAAVLR